jgi:hypothetical protein
MSFEFTRYSFGKADRQVIKAIEQRGADVTLNY